MKFAAAKMELERRIGLLVGLLDLEGRDAAGRCAPFFKHQLADIARCTLAIQLRCLVRDRLIGRMPMAQANAFSETATQQLQALVRYAGQLLEEMEVPFGFSADQAGTSAIEPPNLWRFEGIPLPDRTLIQQLPPATGEALREWTTLWCLSSVNGLRLDDARFDVTRAATRGGLQDFFPMHARIPGHDADHPVLLLDYLHDGDYLLPQRILHDFAPELLWETDCRIALPLSLNWILVQFEGFWEFGMLKPTGAFQGAPPRR